MAAKTYTIHDKTRDLAEEMRKDASLKPIYLKITRECGATVLSLSRHSGDRVYCVSNADCGSALANFHEAAARPAAPIAELRDSAKRPKQCSLFSFIKKQ